MQCILVKSDQFENSSPLLDIFLKSCLCCCSLATLAAQQQGSTNSRNHHFLPECFIFNRIRVHCASKNSMMSWRMSQCRSVVLYEKKIVLDFHSSCLKHLGDSLWHLHFKLTVSFFSSLSSGLVELLNEKKSSLLKLEEYQFKQNKVR